MERILVLKISGTAAETFAAIRRLIECKGGTLTLGEIARLSLLRNRENSNGENG